MLVPLPTVVNYGVIFRDQLHLDAKFGERYRDLKKRPPRNNPPPKEGDLAAGSRFHRGMSGAPSNPADLVAAH